MVATRWLRAGRLSQAEITRRLGVSRQSVSRWQAMLTAGGPRALHRSPHTGRPAKLDDGEWQRLARVLTRGAARAGFDTERWTLRRVAAVAAVVEREFGVRYHFRSRARVLRAHGWTPQQLAVQARERDEALVAAWLQRDWPPIKRGLGAEEQRLPSWTRRVHVSAPRRNHVGAGRARAAAVSRESAARDLERDPADRAAR